ncbi:nuclear cap-binding protein subunit 1 [Pseudohyphozyma bogoriensis]|nr:nuclear cap-binding protein subunit 1 [Pseudohyphozyma bogoriensis]
MSYNQGYGGGYNQGYGEDDYNDSNARRRSNNQGDYSSQRRDPYRPNGPPPPTSTTMFKENIWALGDSENGYIATEEIPYLAQSIISQYKRDPKPVFEAFRVAATELPHKLSHYASLVAFLALSPVEPSSSSGSAPSSAPPPAGSLAARLSTIPGLPSKPKAEGEDAATAEAEAPAAEEKPAVGEDVEMKTEEDTKSQPINVGKAVMEDLGMAIQGFVNEDKWRPARYCLLLLSSVSSLIPAVLPQSTLLVMLAPFKAALSSAELSASKGDTIVRILVETALRCAITEPGEIKDAVGAYHSGRRVDNEILGKEGVELEDRLESLISVFSHEGPLYLPELFASPFADLPVKTSASEISPVELKAPEVSLEKIKTEEEVEETIPLKTASAGLRGDEGKGVDGVRFYMRLFDDETVPAPYDPAGYLLRSVINDIIQTYEVNRKEAARILLDLPKWLKPGTFKGKDAKKDEDRREREKSTDGDDVKETKWVLEHMVVESILTSLFALPTSPLPSSYYHALLTELCRLSPSTVAPALGKCVRRLFNSLGEADSLDPEGVRRFSEWWSVHLSNFGFMWAWADWAPDMDPGAKHPKRVFVERTIDLEVRLSYYDRVQGTIPQVLLDTGVMDNDAPGPHYAYEDPEHKHNAAAASLLRLIKTKGAIEEVEDELASFQSMLERESGLSEEEAAKVKRDMAIQTMLTVGSRSFSHFLNVLERYLPLLRTLSASPAARLELLQTIGSYWRRNAQFHLIVLDKVLQYRLVDPGDVLAWIFAVDGQGRGKSWSKIDIWSALSLTTRTVLGRVEQNKRRVEVAKARAEGDADAEEIEVMTSQLESAERELAAFVVEIIRNFSTLLPLHASTEDWETWWTEGWFREFCRSLSSTRVLEKPSVVEGVDKLALDADSIVVKIIDACKAWNSIV